MFVAQPIQNPAKQKKHFPNTTDNFFHASHAHAVYSPNGDLKTIEIRGFLYTKLHTTRVTNVQT